MNDESRPLYHFQPPANWMNDPNGPIFHDGHYHLFYQHNPNGEGWGDIHWGHARSNDLVHWEHLPIALAPSKDAGEDHCFSGCSIINPKSVPMIFYTSIGPNRRAEDSAEQWSAIGSNDLITWRKHPSNPILTESLHGDMKIYDWRDPFVFREQGIHYMVLGGNLNHRKGGGAVVGLYRATTDDLDHWEFLGILFHHPDPSIVNIECPNFFKIDDKWVLNISPHARVESFVGAFDPLVPSFNIEQSSIFDYGKCFYAPNCMLDPSGRRILWGWIRGFPTGRGWNGCLTLPRVLTLTADGRIRQERAPELRSLRADSYSIPPMSLTDSEELLRDIRGDCLELMLEIDPGNAIDCGIRVRCADDGGEGVSITIREGVLEVGGKSGELPSSTPNRPWKLHIFLDRSVLEVNVDEQTYLTHVIDVPPNHMSVSLFARGGTARIESLEVWKMRSIRNIERTNSGEDD